MLKRSLNVIVISLFLFSVLCFYYSASPFNGLYNSCYIWHFNAKIHENKGVAVVANDIAVFLLVIILSGALGYRYFKSLDIYSREEQFGNMSRGILKRFLDKRVTLTNLCTP